MEHNQDFTVNHAIIVARDILRKYKDRPKTKDILTKITPDLLNFITESESKAAFIYILGEFCDKIESSTSIIENLIEGFTLETFVNVRLQILTASIKNYVNKPEDSEELIKLVLQKGGEESENPDVRDRAYLYWRLLENDPELARDMILGERPGFEFTEDTIFDGDLSTNIIENMTNVSAVYHKNSAELIPKEDMIYDENVKLAPTSPTAEKTKSMEQISDKTKPVKEKKEKPQSINFIDLDDIPTGNEVNNQQNNNNNKVFNMGDIIGFGTSNSGGNDFDFIGSGNSSQFSDESASIKIFNGVGITPQPVNLCISPSDQGMSQVSGLAIYTSFARENGVTFLGVYAKNYSQNNISNIEIFLNNNSFGVAVANQSQSGSIAQGSSLTLKIPLELNNEKNDRKPPPSPFKLDVCFKCSLDVFYFSSPFLLHNLFSETGKMANQAFVEFFKTNSGNTTNITLTPNTNTSYNSDDALNRIFEKNNIFQVAKNNKANPPLTYYSCSVSNVINCIVQASVSNGVNLKVISNVGAIVPLVRDVIETILA